jgi:hypothetical protein
MIEDEEKVILVTQYNNTNNIKPVYYINISFFASHSVNKWTL